MLVNAPSPFTERAGVEGFPFSLFLHNGIKK
jgi:hypothetical protein